MPSAPPNSVLQAFLAPSSKLVRRLEICEFDGVTPWRPELWNSLVSDGSSVSVDYSRDDRRNMQITLDNYDGELDHRPGNLWYDKVFKLFYGIEVPKVERKPSIVIMEEYNAPGAAVALKARLNAAGYTLVRINPEASTMLALNPYDIIISVSADYTRKLSLLQQAFAAGKSVLCFSLSPTAAQLPLLVGTADSGTISVTGAHSISKEPSVAHPAQLGWDEWVTSAAVTHRRALTAAAGAVSYARWYDAANGFSSAGIAYDQAAGPRWVYIQHIDFALSSDPGALPQLTGMIGSAVKWLDNYVPITYWEAQIGEFVAEQIQTSSTSKELTSITGRDYSKRCLESKLATATTFTQGTSLEVLIRNLASNSYCFKTNLPPTGVTLSKDITFESDTNRFEMMKELCEPSGYEIFFNSEGFLTMRKFQDPLLTPATFDLTNHPQFGNLVERSTSASDARLRNHIIVKGESSDSTVLPVWAEARNDRANSPSRIAKIGDRVDTKSSALYVSTAQCKAAAEDFLRVASLEEFDMSFSAIMFPWVEVGEILELDPAVENSGVGEPDRFLISSINIPLDLGPMSGNAKRVTIVV